MFLRVLQAKLEDNKNLIVIYQILLITLFKFYYFLFLPFLFTMKSINYRPEVTRVYFPC